MQFLKVFILIFPLFTFGQKGFVVLRDGQKIGYDKWEGSQDKNQTTLVTEDGKMQINRRDIDGYFLKSPIAGPMTRDEGRFYFYRLVRVGNEVDYTFLERVISGKINIYYDDLGWYLIEKNEADTAYYFFAPMGFESKKGALDLLRSYVSDNQEILAMINDELKTNILGTFPIIRAYNVAEFKETQNIAVDSSELVLYRRERRNIGERLKVSVGRNILSMDGFSMVKLKLPSNELIKVCMDEAGKFCDIIKIPRHYTLYYEIVENIQTGELTLKQNGSANAKEDLKIVESYLRRKN